MSGGASESSLRRAHGRVRSSVALATLAIVAAAGCSKALHLPPVTNQRPEIILTQSPVSRTTPYFYSYTLYWTSFDPDGRVVKCRYAVDPPTSPGADTAWVSTTANRVTLTFHSDDIDSLGTPANPGGFHTFVIEAIDDRGAASPSVSRAFFSFTVAPIVQIVDPVGTHLTEPLTTPNVTIRWRGSDPDGQHTQKPVKYKFHLFSESDVLFPFIDAVTNPDSLRNRFAPNFEGWDSTTTDTSKQYFGLVPDHRYLFVIFAFDEAGAYSPIMSFETNVLLFFVTFTGTNGPAITLFNDFFSYTYLSGGINLDPRSFIDLEVPANTPITLHWSAVPPRGAAMKQYRWCMDIDQIDDETPRANERTDLRHWSQWDLFTTTAALGSFTGADSAGGGGENHLFYVEAEDNNGLTSLGVIYLQVVRPSFEHELLFVDDTRMPGDLLVTIPPSTDSVQAPPGQWPSAAELDTFFFARGGVQWRDYPPGTLSPPGICAGYAFDTLGTRGIVTGVVPLATLARYRHVVWYTDQAVQFDGNPTSPSYPQNSLRWMSASGRANNLALYIRLGGRVWLSGGGAAYATLIAYNSRANDNGATIFSNAAGELVSGRFMYDLARWQSELGVLSSRTAIRSPRAIGGWPGAPDYALLPAQLQQRSPATDPLPPLRGYGTYYLQDYEAEYLTQPNTIVEDADPDPNHEDLQQALDTLYTTNGGFAPTGKPVMTLHRGFEGPEFLFSGFPVWYFQRDQAIALCDWVLQTLWGLPRDPVSRTLGPAPAIAHRSTHAGR